MKVLNFFTLFTLSFLIFCGCNSSKDTSKNELKNIPGKVIVLLENGTNPKKLEAEFSNYELKNQGQISRAEYRFSFSYNAAKISGDKLVEEINALSYASDAKVAQVKE